MTPTEHNDGPQGEPNEDEEAESQQPEQEQHDHDRTADDE
jgi:hypothetical protein